ncbi:MAG: flagellar biosynthetic protein FliQ [Chloroflexi bacterium]|nr:flagellar biosynthetic protein FliQ [Chloroflexota bacterium]
MTEAYIITLAQNSLLLVAVVAGPVLLSGMAVGVLVSLLQAATQITEPTLTFVPKVFAIGLVLILFGSWMAQQLVAFTVGLFTSLPTLVR